MGNYRPPSRERALEIVTGLNAFMEKAGEILAAQSAKRGAARASIENARFPKLAKLSTSLFGEQEPDPWDEVGRLSEFNLSECRERTRYREVIEAADAACATLHVLSDTDDPVEEFPTFHEIEEFRNRVIGVANQLDGRY